MTIILEKPQTIDQATSQRDALAEMLHDVGVQIGLIDPNVACDGPQLLAAMGAYVEHLKAENEASPPSLGAPGM